MKRDSARSDDLVALARSITKTGSKQTFYTARLVVDTDLVDDFYRAYAYFRWADDVIDVSTRSREERVAFVDRQKELIDLLYRKERVSDLEPEERILADLIDHDRSERSGLWSFVMNMMAIIDFDARRRGRLISQQELAWYSERVARSVTDGIQYFVGNGHPYPDSSDRYLAGTAAHITHLLRDMRPDIADGFVNIPREYLDAHHIGPEDVDSPPFREWVRQRTELARRYFDRGKGYLDQLSVLRCKIAAYWYCARFEPVLETIEQDDFLLRTRYDERRSAWAWFKFGWLGISIALKHANR